MLTICTATPLSVQNRRHPPNTPDPRQSDRVFVWKIENPRPDSIHARGLGLEERGSLIEPGSSWEEVSTSDRRDTRHFRISIDASAPRQPFNNDALHDILENPESQLQHDLAAKLIQDALASITRLCDEEADYLDTLYDPVAIDLGTIRHDRSIDETTRQRLVEARLGQGQFRRQVLERWRRRCVVTGCTLEDILRASHIKPWRSCTDDERLNPANGLLLTANLDALFDRCSISFEDDGRMLVSGNISPSEREMLGIPQDLRSDLTLRTAPKRC